MPDHTNTIRGLFIPLVFVSLWSTGFIGAKYGLPAAEPFTFLSIRMLITVAILALIIPFFQVHWPRRVKDYIHLGVVGILIHGIYLGGVFSAIHRGVDSGLSAVIVGLQPIATVMLSAVWIKEHVSATKVGGMILGFAGILVVISDRGIGVSGIDMVGLVFCVMSLFAIAIGTIYQKRFCTQYDLLPGICIQYVATAGFVLILAFTFETREVIWSQRFFMALAWLVLVLSIGAVLLLMWLIRHGEAGKIASLFYLVPPFVAVEAWFLFDERVSLVALGGIALCVCGVAIVMNAPEKART